MPAAEVEAMAEQVATFERLRLLYGENLAVSEKLADARRAEAASDAALAQTTLAPAVQGNLPLR
ncbi:MAG: hypothetical protein OXN89_21690 [Bryobacterales bacterium]|nr:hypothetical protein [Bryobacterales bacterium]